MLDASPNAQTATTDRSIGHQLEFLAPGLVHGFGNSLFAIRGAAHVLSAPSNDPSRSQRVIVDASFGADAWRTQFLRLGMDHAVPAWFVHVITPPEMAEDRIRRRSGDASDADVDIYRRARDGWEPDSDAVAPRAVLIDGSDSGNGARDAVVQMLARHGLAGRSSVRGAGPQW